MSSRISDFTPWQGRPARVTIYEGGQSGNHGWLPGARLARVTVIGAGGGGGITGKWADGGVYRYNAGGGGAAGAMNRALLQLDPAGEPVVPYAVGAGSAGAGGSSYFGALSAEGGAAGAAGANNAATPGGATQPAGQITSTIYGTGSITRPRQPSLLPGSAGAAGSNTLGTGTSGEGGSTLYGWGAHGVANPLTGAPEPGLSPASGQYGAGASGGSAAESTATSHTIAPAAAGAGGVIIIEEWTA